MKAPKYHGAAPPKVPSGRGGSVKPRLHTPAHLRLAGRSAFPPQNAAFGPPDPGTPPFGPAPDAGMGGGAAGGGPSAGGAPGDVGP